MIDLTYLNDVPPEYLLVYISVYISIGWLQALIFKRLISRAIIGYLNTDLIGMSNEERELKWFIGRSFFVMFWPVYSVYLLFELIIFICSIRLHFDWKFEVNPEQEDKIDSCLNNEK